MSSLNGKMKEKTYKLLAKIGFFVLTFQTIFNLFSIWDSSNLGFSLTFLIAKFVVLIPLYFLLAIPLFHYAWRIKTEKIKN